MGPIKNHQGVLVFDVTEKAEAMNLYFLSIGGKLARDLPRIQINNGENINAQTTKSKSSAHFYFKLFERALLKIKPGKALDKMKYQQRTEVDRVRVQLSPQYDY